MENKEHTEFDTRDELAAKRKNINTFDELIDFIKDVKDNYQIGYGDEPRAIAQACLAVGWYLAKVFGITNFQASFVMWDFVLGWEKTNNKTSLKLIDYDDMLYPQYSYKFDKTLSPEVWQLIQDAAKENMRDAEEGGKTISLKVYDHWKSIAAGEIPFGYKLEGAKEKSPLAGINPKKIPTHKLEYKFKR